MGLQTFEYLYMDLKVVLQDCNGFSNNQRRRDNLKGFLAYIQTQKLQMVHLNHKVNIILHMTNPCETTPWVIIISEGAF